MSKDIHLDSIKFILFSVSPDGNVMQAEYRLGQAVSDGTGGFTFLPKDGSGEHGLATVDMSAMETPVASIPEAMTVVQTALVQKIIAQETFNFTPGTDHFFRADGSLLL
jgi:hypothetical protein